MIHVFTLFDYTKRPIRPLQSVIYDDHSKDVDFHTFFLPNTGIKLYEIFKRIDKFKKIFDKPVVVNDFKAHIEGFGLDLHTNYSTFEAIAPEVSRIPIEIIKAGRSKLLLTKLLKSFVILKPQRWQNILARVQPVYRYLETRETYDGYDRLNYRYKMTNTGRSKTTGWNIQGATKKNFLRFGTDIGKAYIHFDWVAADMRVATLMSKDEYLEQSFAESDPYTQIASELGDDYDRDDCKIEFLSGIYSLSPDNVIFGLCPTFQSWMKDRIVEMVDSGVLRSILGRPFSVKKENYKSVFSGMIQGSVAHAMHNSLIKVYREFPSNILVETHDSITMICDKTIAKDVINKVSAIMLRPFSGIINSNPLFPVKVYVGESWKNWKFLRVYR